VDGGDDYHFKFKISLVGDSGVGKSAFLDAISSTLGTVVENEISSELHMKVKITVIYQFEYRLRIMLMMRTSTK
jgi:hypothetical protein